MLVFQISLEGCGASTASSAATAAAYRPILRDTSQRFGSLFLCFLLVLLIYIATLSH